MSEQLQELIESLSKLDHRKRIIGSFLITRKADSISRIPQTVKEGWMGSELPIRLPSYLNLNEANLDVIVVTTGDVIASLLAQGQDEAAQFYEDRREQHDHRLLDPHYFFLGEEGKTAIDSPISTESYYRNLANRNRK